MDKSTIELAKMNQDIINYSNDEKCIKNIEFIKSRFTSEEETYLLLNGYKKYIQKFHKIYYFFNMRKIDKSIKSAFNKEYANKFEYNNYFYLNKVVNTYEKVHLMAIVKNELLQLLKFFGKNYVLKKIK